MLNAEWFLETSETPLEPCLKHQYRDTVKQSHPGTLIEQLMDYSAELPI